MRINKNKAIRDSSLYILELWISKVKEYIGGSSLLQSIELEYNLANEIRQLTGKQLKIINSLIVAGYNKGCADTRKAYNKE